MAERIEPGVTKGPDAIRIAALDIEMFNAAALPGGHIVVFKKRSPRLTSPTSSPASSRTRSRTSAAGTSPKP